MERGPRNVHHRLPSSRGGDNGPENLITINAERHAAWHVIMRNKTPNEVAHQLSVWMGWGHIFIGERRLRFVADKLDSEGSKGIWARMRGNGNLRNIHSSLSREQREAWELLFGLSTKPDVVIRAINEYLVHPRMPIQPVKPRRWWSSR